MPDTPRFDLPSLSRRGFLGALTAPLAASALAACSRGGDAADTAAAAPAVDSPRATAAANPGALGLGLQLYTVRSLMEKDVDGTLAALAAAGFRNVETAGYYGRTAQQFKDALAKQGLQAVSMHVPIQQIRANPAQVMEEANLLGATYIVCPWLDEAERTEAGYQKVGQDLSKLAEQWTGNGRTVAYHNHDFEFLRVGNKAGWEVLYDAASPAVKAELDLFWAVKAGQDALTIADRYPGRIVLVHAKDAGPPPERTMTDVGAGTIPFATILPALKTQGLAYAFVEHDNPADPLATVKAGLTHLNGLKV